MTEVCPQCGLPKELCVCETIAKESQKIIVTTINKKFGKVNTVIKGIDNKERSYSLRTLRRQRGIFVRDSCPARRSSPRRAGPQLPACLLPLMAKCFPRSATKPSPGGCPDDSKPGCSLCRLLLPRRSANRAGPRSGQRGLQDDSFQQFEEGFAAQPAICPAARSHNANLTKLKAQTESPFQQSVHVSISDQAFLQSIGNKPVHIKPATHSAWNVELELCLRIRDEKVN